MPQKLLELTVQEAMSEISGHGMASLTGLITVHSSLFRNVPVNGTYVGLSYEPGPVVADGFGSVKVPVVSEHKHDIDLRMAKLMDGVRVRKVVWENSVLYCLKGDVDNPFNRGWLGLGRQTYHYNYSVIVDLVIVASPAYGTA